MRIVSEMLAFVRRDALVAASYRTNMIASVGSLLLLILPLYFVSGALQPIVGASIESEGGQYFGFVVLGVATFQFVLAAVGALPASISSGLRSGTFEALLTTRVSASMLLLGSASYPFAWTVVKGIVMVMAGQFLGADFVLGRLPVVLGIWVLITLAYLPFGVLGAALLLVARTTGPVPQLVLAGSLLLGGVYYPTSVIPSWLQYISAVIPLKYGLRALRKVMVQDVQYSAVAVDLAVLAAISAALLVMSLAAFNLALSHGRRTGSLALY